MQISVEHVKVYMYEMPLKVSRVNFNPLKINQTNIYHLIKRKNFFLVSLLKVKPNVFFFVVIRIPTNI